MTNNRSSADGSVGNARKSAQPNAGTDPAPPSATVAPNPARSLMDDSEFLSELEQIEQHIDSDVAAAPFRGAFDDLDHGLGHTGHSPEPQWRHEPAENADADEETTLDEPPARRDVALAVLGFVLLMALGAVGAAFVFHDRLALLFR